MKKLKTYSKPVFSGKDVPVIGLDQGKGRLYHGLGTHVCFNLHYDASMDSREGQDITQSYNDYIQNADKMKTLRFVHEGTNVWVEGV